MRFIIMGGDRRHEELARLAEANGHAADRVQDGPLPESNGSAPERTVWVLPILSLAQQDGRLFIKGLNGCPLDGVVSRLRNGDVLCYADLAGEMDAVRETAPPRALFLNLLRQERFVSRNAVLTAEGSVCLAAQCSARALADSECLVTGYGHIGKVLSGYLQSLGARVWVSARRDADLSAIMSHSMNAVHTYQLHPVVGRMDFIFNTVPARIIDAGCIGLMKRGAQVLDLASAPFGADEQLMENAGLSYQRYPGIPGRMYPVSAARVIYDEIDATAGTAVASNL